MLWTIVCTVLYRVFRASLVSAFEMAQVTRWVNHSEYLGHAYASAASFHGIVEKCYQQWPARGARSRHEDP